MEKSNKPLLKSYPSDRCFASAGLLQRRRRHCMAGLQRHRAARPWCQFQGRPSRNQSLVPPSAAPAGYGLLVAAGELERPQRVQLVVVLIDVLAGTNA